MKDTHPNINNAKRHNNNSNKDSNEFTRMEELEKQLYQKDLELKNLQEKMTSLEERFQEIQSEKKRLSKRLDELELQKIELKLKNCQEIKDNYLKIKHRSQITKEQLDDTRENLKILEGVIEDLKKRGFMDYLLRRFPESFQRYHKYKKV